MVGVTAMMHRIHTCINTMPGRRTHRNRIIPVSYTHLDVYKRQAVYTQTTDVEGEINGLMTYDRKVIKMNEAKVCLLYTSRCV